MPLAIFSIFTSSFMLALSGAMMPGPVFTVTVSESARRGGKTGPLMIFGHGILELTLVLALLAGFAPFLARDDVFIAVSLCGGIILSWMAFTMFRSLPELTLEFNADTTKSHNLVLTGIILSLANPYWFIWWATIGMGYIMYAMQFGLPGIISFFAGHILADLGWYSLVSFSVARGGRFLSDALYRKIIGFCASFLLIFAFYFFWSGVTKIVLEGGDMEKKLLIDAITNWGATLVGVADTGLLKGIETDPKDLLADFPRAISIAIHLSDAIIDTIHDRPTPIYSSHYSRVNTLLDNIALQTVNFLQARGAMAVPIPASLILDDEKWTSFISHKAVAIAAGIGWQGKSLLLVTPQYGPRVRLVTVLTDADLSPDDPLKNRCGPCTECRDNCPAGAIRGASTNSHFANRNEALRLERCVYQVRDVFSRLPNVVPLICGVCIGVCPWGKSRSENP